MKIKPAKRGFFASSSFSMAALFATLLGVCALIVGYFLYDFGLYLPQEHFPRFMILNIVIVICVTAVVLVSFLIAYFVVTRINLITETAEQIIETGDLTKRIQISTKLDDLSNLAQVLNSLLARIEELMNDVKDVGDMLAHDLRTPLTHLRQRCEALPEGKVLLPEIDKVLEIFNALLRISNLEKAKQTTAFREVNLYSIIDDCIALYEPIFEESGSFIDFDLQNITILGDENLLFQMVSNLLSNAIKYGLSEKGVHLCLKNEDTSVLLIIADKGKGIAASEREKVFERFYRLDISRNTEGNGLGLSLVKAIVNLHKGSIWLEDNQPGLSVKITLPTLQKNKD